MPGHGGGMPGHGGGMPGLGGGMPGQGGGMPGQGGGMPGHGGGNPGQGGGMPGQGGGMPGQGGGMPGHGGGMPGQGGGMPGHGGGAGVLGLNGWRGSKMEAPASNDAVVADNNGAAIFHSAQEQMASTHRFHPVCGKQVAISDHVTASRVPNSFSHGLVFSAEPLQNEEVFEVRVQKIHPHFAGSIRIGLTNLNVNGTHFLASNVANSVEGLATMKPSVAMVDGNVLKDGVVIKENYASSLDRVGVNTRVGVKRCEDATMHVLINGEDVGVAAT